MKTRMTILGLLIAGASFAQQAEITNGFDGFETWTSAEVGELPEYWDGFNKNVEFNGMTVGTVECVTKSSTDPFEGNYSVMLTSTSIMGGPAVPGIVTTGDFVVDWNAQDGDVEGGEPYTQLPIEMYGQFKYAPASVDTGFVSIWFLENGNEVGSGYLEFTGTVSDWTAFTVNINFDPGAAPDSMNVMFSSSKAESNLPVGTVLEIDAIGFSAYLSTGALEIQEIKCYPNPTTDIINVELANAANGTLSLIDMNGAVVQTQQVAGTSLQLDVAAVASGTYQVQLDTHDGSISQTIIVD